MRQSKLRIGHSLRLFFGWHLTWQIFIHCRFTLTIRQEVFQKVERQYMLGLRATDPEMRNKFFSLYNASLAKTLFARLQYIIQLQDWEALGDVFWLKQGLDLLLAVLVVDKPITLASNSARVPALVSSGSSDGSLPQAQVDLPEGPEEAPLTFEGLVLKHAKFLNDMSKLQVLFSFVFMNKSYCHRTASFDLMLIKSYILAEDIARE